MTENQAVLQPLWADSLPLRVTEPRSNSCRGVAGSAAVNRPFQRSGRIATAPGREG